MPGVLTKIYSYILIGPASSACFSSVRLKA